MTALELWPEAGIPEHAGAWLMTTATRRGIDSPKGSDHIEIVGAPTSRQFSSVNVLYLSRCRQRTVSDWNCDNRGVISRLLDYLTFGASMPRVAKGEFVARAAQRTLNLTGALRSGAGSARALYLTRPQVSQGVSPTTWLLLRVRKGGDRLADMASPLFDFIHLTPVERIQLAEDLWDSLPQDSALPPGS